MGKRDKRKFFTQHKINVEYKQTCSLKGNLRTESTPVRVKEVKRMNFHSTQNQRWHCTNMFIERQLTCWECTSSQHSKWVKQEKEGMNFHSTQNQCWLCTKHVHLKATYALRHQFTTQQVGKGDKKNEFSRNTKSMLTLHKHVHWKATYLLRVHQFTA